jgi:subtilisin family serine protease
MFSRVMATPISTRFKRRWSRSVILGCFLLCASISALGATATDWADQKKQHYQSLKQLFISTGTSTGVTAPTKIRIIVDIQPSVPGTINTNNSIATLVSNQAMEVKRNLPRLNMMAINVSEAQLDALFASSQVRSFSEDTILEPNLDISVPFIGAKALQNSGNTGSGQTLAIFDTGVDSSHPFLDGRVIEEACFSSGDQQYSFSLCPNNQTKQLGTGAAKNCNSTNLSRDCMHGTHVAGIAAGASDTMTGVAPAAKIIAVQVFTYFPNSSRLGAYRSDIIAAFDWLIYEAKSPQIASINMSLGGGGYTNYCDDVVPSLTQAITLLRTRGTATVIASGNNGFTDQVSWPGCITSAVTVGASEHNQDTMAWFSNTATMVDVVAPGMNITSSVPNNGFVSMSGTSMATPHVTGAFAQLKAIKPSASVDELEQALKNTGKLIHTSSGIDLPRIDVLSAAQQLTLNGAKVEAEHYLNMSGVGTEPTQDTGGGLNVGWIDTGDWMTYSVTLPTTGSYLVTYRVASPNANGEIKLENAGGSPVYGSTKIPNTGGWQQWTNITQVVALAGGKQTLAIYAKNGGFNINWLSFTLISQAPLATIEAENYSYMSGVQTETTTDTGGGLNVGWIDTGDWFSYVNTPITIPQSGNYTIELRLASPNNNGLLSFEEAGSISYASVPVPNTGGWQQWTSVKTTVYLSAGTHSFGIGAKTGGWNINWFRISAAQ